MENRIQCHWGSGAKTNGSQSRRRHKQSPDPSRIVKWALCQLEDVRVPAHGECPHRGQAKSRLTLRRQSIIPAYVTRVLNMSTCGPSCNLTFSVLPCNVDCFWNFFWSSPLCFFFLLLSVSLSVRTALIAIIGFMPTKGEGAIGSLDYTPEERRALAKK